MSDVRSGSSSDLTLARELSRRLVVDGRAAKPAPVGPAPLAYVRFPAHRAAPTVDAPAPVRRLPDPPIVSIDQGSLCWEQLLEWCLVAFDAEAAFVMDAYGLVVANRGRMTPDAVQGVGARLMVALQHAAQMAVDTPDGTSRALAVELATGWLSGLRVVVGEGEDALQLTVGIVAKAPFARDERLAVERAFAAAAPRE